MDFAISDCRIYDNRIYYRNQLFVPANDEFKMQIIYRTYSSGPVGHPGRMKTIELIGRSYFWPRMTQDIQAFVKACEFCSRTKASRSAFFGYLHLLPVPFQAWQNILINCVIFLPICEKNGEKYNHIAVIVCRLTKMRHFIPTKGLTAAELADAFVRRVYSCHGSSLDLTLGHVTIDIRVEGAILVHSEGAILVHSEGAILVHSEETFDTFGRSHPPFTRLTLG
jgi:hypothetical protein